MAGWRKYPSSSVEKQTEYRQKRKSKSKAHDKERYPYEKTRRAAAQQRRRKSNLVRLWELKESNPCMDCNEFFPAICMDFDHRDAETKVNCVGSMIGFNWETIETEISKCDLVCSNCHRIRTDARRRQLHDT